MTINNLTMKSSKNCIQLNAAKKMKIKLDTNGKIMYVNNYFTEVTNFKVHELILKEFINLLSEDMPKFAQEYVLDFAQEYPVGYFIIKGNVKGGDCYWGVARISQELNEMNEVKGYLLEIKMLPSTTIDKIDKLYEVLKEIENNAGMKAAEKYFNGYLEEKGYTLNDFVLNVTEINEKQAGKYFEIDEDAKPKKKKKGWF